jgi:DNA-binding LytR/AlgR family response regulator
MKSLRAIIVDDEDVLRTYLKKKLALFWPELEVAGEARDGEAALRLIHDLRPDIAFLDIKMPGLSGLEVAGRAAGACLFVFITAHDQFAIEAFESEAVDYLLKPVTEERLGKTIERLKARLSSSGLPELKGVFERLSRTLAPSSGHLQWIKAQHKDGVRLIPVSEVYFFRTTDKYTTVRTRDSEFLIRKSIKELEGELDPAQFWRVHRAAIVNARAIHTVKRDLAGTHSIRFRDIPDHVVVSRACGHLFKQM